MKKAIPLFTALLFLFNTVIFAVGDGDDPLDTSRHPGRTTSLRRHFEREEIDKRDAEYPCMWVEHPSFWFWSGDYRAVRVYNMPHLTRDAGDSFLRANLRALLEARIIATQDREIARAAAGLGVKLLGDKLKEVCPHDIRVISNFLETDFESATESIVLGLSMACISQVAHGIAVCGVFLDMLGKLTPGIGLVVAVADIASFFATRSALAKERTLNYAKLLSYIYEMLLSGEAVGKILESNVLVTAVDERSFTAIIRLNAFRRNDGAWCDFRHIGELRCAPIARNYRGGQIIQRIIDIYNRVMRDGDLDLDAAHRYVNDVPAIERPLQEARAEETHG